MDLGRKVAEFFLQFTSKSTFEENQITQTELELYSLVLKVLLLQKLLQSLFCYFASQFFLQLSHNKITQMRNQCDAKRTEQLLKDV